MSTLANAEVLFQQKHHPPQINNQEKNGSFPRYTQYLNTIPFETNSSTIYLSNEALIEEGFIIKSNIILANESEDNRKEVKVLGVSDKVVTVHMARKGKHFVRKYNLETRESNDYKLPKKFDNVLRLIVDHISNNTIHILNETTGSREVLHLN
ncbi:MAG: hypothetical protein VYA54_03485 [Bdellovibrionota bacterium]|nr:hypothetical protein [Bdellovibrionota bacterium]